MPPLAPTTGPGTSLFNRAPLLTPEALRGEIQRLTADQLDQLVREMDRARNVPPIFRNALVQRAIEDRIAVADATREQWRALQRLIETTPPPAPIAPPPAPLSFPPSPTQSPSGRITGETGVREWMGDHTGMIAATAGLAILGFLAIRHIAKRREQFEREDKEDADRAGQPGATAPEARKRSWFWKLLIPGAAIGIPSAIAIKAYQNRKEIAAKAKEGAEKTQKAVKESAEAQEGIESARYGLVSAGLLLLDRDLMPESLRMSDSERRRILTGFMEDQRVQNVPMSQILSMESERDVARVFPNICRTPDERRILFFLVQSCKKHQEYVMGKARRMGLSDEDIMQMPLIEYIDQLAEISSTFGKFTNEIISKGADGLANIDWNKDIFNFPQLIHNLKTDRIFMRRLTEHYPELQTKENAFLLFCAANGNKSMHNLPQQLRDNIPEDKRQEWAVFQSVLERMHQFIQDQSDYLRQYAHGEERFTRPLQQYLDNHLTVFDTVQIYSYLQQMIGEDGHFLALKDSPHFTTFLLQAKIISMVKRENEDAGKRMLVNLTTRGIGSALGAATNIELPEKAKELFWSAAGTITGAAHTMLTEAVHKAKIFYQEGLRTSPLVVGGATAGVYAFSQIKLNNVFDAYDAKWFIRTPAKDIAARYGITEAKAGIIKTEAGNTFGKTWLQKYTRPGFESRTMHQAGGIWDMIREGQKEIDDVVHKHINKHMQTIQKGFTVNAENVEGSLRSATDRSTARNIMRTFNDKNQNIIREGLDEMAKKIPGSTAKTFAELAEKQPNLAQGLMRNLQQQNLVTAFGHKMSFISGSLNSIQQGTITRAKTFVPLLILRALTSEEKIPLANLAGSTAIQLTPFVGTGYDVVTLITGKDQITGEEISRLQSAGFVVIGAATDTLTALGVIFGFGVGGAAGVGARAAAFSARAGVKAVKAVKTASKASEAMAQATRIALRAEKVARVARFARIGGYTFTIGNIAYGVFSSDGEAPTEDSEDMMG